MFHFWLNSESIRHRDLPRIYEKQEFTIPEGSTDEELIQLILPTEVYMEFPKAHRQSRLSIAARMSITGGNARLSMRGDREMIEHRIKEISEIQEKASESIKEYEEFDLNPLVDNFIPTVDGPGLQPD
jgi:hypothetical protein